RLPDRRDRRVAFQPVDIAVIGIDRIEPAGKFVLAQHRQQPARDFLQIARSADQSDTVGREEGVEWMLVFADRSRRRHSERSLFILVRNVRKARGVDTHAARRKVTPPSRNWSPATACPFFFAASRTASISPTRNVRPLMMSLAP